VDTSVPRPAVPSDIEGTHSGYSEGRGDFRAEGLSSFAKWGSGPQPNSGRVSTIREPLPRPNLPRRLGCDFIHSICGQPAVEASENLGVYIPVIRAHTGRAVGMSSSARHLAAGRRRPAVFGAHFPHQESGRPAGNGASRFPRTEATPCCPCCFCGPCASAFFQAVRQNLRCPCNPCLSLSISVSP
jgi:hypothetical protein